MIKLHNRLPPKPALWGIVYSRPSKRCPPPAGLICFLAIQGICTAGRPTAARRRRHRRLTQVSNLPEARYRSVTSGLAGHGSATCNSTSNGLIGSRGECLPCFVLSHPLPRSTRMSLKLWSPLVVCISLFCARPAVPLSQDPHSANIDQLTSVRAEQCSAQTEEQPQAHSDTNPIFSQNEFGLSGDCDGAPRGC